MKLACVLAVLLSCTMALALDYQPIQVSEDFLLQQPEYCTFRYYYFIPCPEASWFWVISGWQPGTRLGMMLGVNDPQIGGQGTQCPNSATILEGFRFLDFAGYGTVYPGLYTVTFDVYCADRDGCFTLLHSGIVVLSRPGTD